MTFHKTILKSGLRLVVVPMKDHPTVTVTVLVEAGSKYETKPLSGISHFLEHMCFKGTKKRPKAIDIVKELDGIGAHYNAFTAQEVTGYFAKSDCKHFEKILDVVSDIYLHSTFPAPEIEKEKGVIVEEIKMYQDLPPRHIHDVLFSLLYGEQPAGWDIAGTEGTVRSITQDALLSYRRAQYVPAATAVIVAGAVDVKQAEKQMAAAFSVMYAGKKRSKIPVKESQKHPALAIEYKKTDQVHLAFGIRTCDLYHMDVPALRVIGAILGGGMSSRLFQKMRDELGICYYVGAAHDLFTDHGILEITAGVPARRLAEAIQAILFEARSLKETAVSDALLSHVKDYLVGNLYLGLESSDSVADFYGHQEIVRKPLQTPEDIVVEIRAVTSDDILRVCRAYFTPARLNLALIGEVKDTAVRGLLCI